MWHTAWYFLYLIDIFCLLLIQVLQTTRDTNTSDKWSNIELFLGHPSGTVMYNDPVLLLKKILIPCVETIVRIGCPLQAVAIAESRWSL